MEFRGVYVLWGLLPFWYVCLTFWVFLRPIFKVAGREKVNQYLPSMLWTGGCFILTLFIDQLGVVEATVGKLIEWGLLNEDIQVNILRFLLYPAVLVAVAQIQKVMTGEDSDRKRNLPKPRWR